MRRFIESTDRQQSTLFPECLEDWICDDNPVRVIDVFVDELDLADLRFDGVDPEVTGRPSYHPAVLLKLYIYGYLNRVQSSRRLEREAGRNVEVMWLTGRLVPDHKTIADFRKDNGPAIRKVCTQFVALCRKTARCCAAIGQRHARIARSRLVARQDRSDASRDGSTNTCSKRCRSVSMRTRRRCACAARRSSIPSARSKCGWEQPTF